jgi:hypothetical protein
LAAFWPHNGAQRCRLLRIGEYDFSRSMGSAQVADATVDLYGSDALCVAESSHS